MKLNYETFLVGQNCVLVPYRPEHVERYHRWMLDPEMLEATGSEPLTLEEEYENQQSWRDDDSKCTFIVLDKSKVTFGHELEESSRNKTTTAERTGVTGPDDDDFFIKTQERLSIVDNLHAMVGDVNMFLSEEDDDDDDEENLNAHTVTPTLPPPPSPFQHAEIDIMVAETGVRRRGVGREATLLMMLYLVTHRPIRRVFCKINASNAASRTLFEHKLQFREHNYAACFEQYEYELKRDSQEELKRMLQEMLVEQQQQQDLTSSTTTTETVVRYSIGTVVAAE